MTALANIHLDSLVPFLVALFWIVNGVSGLLKRRRAKQKREARAESAPRNVVAEEFLEALNDAREARAPKPIQSPAPIETSALRARYGIDEPTPERIEEPDPTADVAPILRNSLQSAMPTIKLPSMNLRFPTAVSRAPARAQSPIDPDDPQTLRRAILGQIILGAPRGAPGHTRN